MCLSCFLCLGCILCEINYIFQVNIEVCCYHCLCVNSNCIPSGQFGEVMMMMIWFLVQTPEHVQITDFGLARLFDDKQAMLSIIREKVNRLSLCYTLTHRLYNSGQSFCMLQSAIMSTSSLHGLECLAQRGGILCRRNCSLLH